MKKFLGVLLLVLLWCNVGYADWKQVAEAIKSKNKVYVDTNSVKKIGNKVIFLQLSSYTTPLDSGRILWLSDIAKTEANCTNKKVRELSLTLYENRMGKGKVLASTDDVTDWYDPKPGSIQMSAINYACK